MKNSSFKGYHFEKSTSESYGRLMEILGSGGKYASREESSILQEAPKSRVSLLVEEIRQQMQKESWLGSQDSGNILGGGAVGATIGALAVKGVKGVRWFSDKGLKAKVPGLVIGGLLGAGAGLGARRTAPTFESSDPLPTYVKPIGMQGT